MTNPTTIIEDTSASDQLLATLRTALLTYADAEGSTAADTLDDRLFQNRAPDNGPFPCATMRLNTRSAGSTHGLRLVGNLEVQLYGRPWSQYQKLLTVADLCDQAMLFLVKNARGLIICYATQRDTPPAAAGAPIDGETAVIRLAYSLIIWPRYLTVVTGNDPL